jgi:hypothetical protein
MWAIIEKLRMRESSVMQPPLAGPPRAFKHGGKAVGGYVRWGARWGWFVGKWFLKSIGLRGEQRFYPLDFLSKLKTQLVPLNSV